MGRVECQGEASDKERKLVRDEERIGQRPRTG